MSEGKLMILYDDVSWGDSSETWTDGLDNLSLVKRFVGFAADQRSLRDCEFVPISKFLDDPAEYRQYLKASGLAFRFYGAKGRVFGDERKERDAFWNRNSVKPKSWREQDAYNAFCRKEEKAALESVETTRKALEQWTQLVNVPGPRLKGSRNAFIVHVCAIVNLDGFVDIINRGDIALAESVARENENDVHMNTTWISNPDPVKAKHMGCIVGSPTNRGDAQTISQYNQAQLKLLVTDYDQQMTNDSAETLRQIISVGLVEATPYKEGSSQDDDTPWNKFIAGDRLYDPRLLPLVWSFVYSPSTDVPASAAAPAPDSPKRK